MADEAADQFGRTRAVGDTGLDAAGEEKVEKIIARDRQVQQDERLVADFAQADSAAPGQRVPGRNEHIGRQFRQPLGLDVVGHRIGVGQRQFEPPAGQPREDFLLVSLLEIDGDARGARREFGQQPRHEPGGERNETPHRDLAGHRRAKRDGASGEIARMVEQDAGLVDEPLPRRGHGHAARMMAYEQRDAEFRLDLRDRGGNGRLRAIEHLGAAADAAGIRRRDDIFKRPKRELHKIPRSN